jgi:transcription initiation factor TFIID subunit TAF12
MSAGGTCEASEVQRLLRRREEGLVDDSKPIIQALGVLQDQVDALNQQVDALKCQQVDAHKMEREESSADAPRSLGAEEKMSAQERLQQAAERWRTHGATTGKDPFLQMVDMLQNGLLAVIEQQRMAEQLAGIAQQITEAAKQQQQQQQQQQAQQAQQVPEETKFQRLRSAMEHVDASAFDFYSPAQGGMESTHSRL